MEVRVPALVLETKAMMEIVCCMSLSFAAVLGNMRGMGVLAYISCDKSSYVSR
jgi:hypothetical protein